MEGAGSLDRNYWNLPTLSCEADDCDVYTFHTIQVNELKDRASRQHQNKAGGASKSARSRFSTQWGAELQVLVKKGC